MFEHQSSFPRSPFYSLHRCRIFRLPVVRNIFHIWSIWSNSHLYVSRPGRWLGSRRQEQFCFSVILLFWLRARDHASPRAARPRPILDLRLCSVARAMAARGMSPFSSAKSILFQRHTTLLVTNNALCLMSGLVYGIWGGTYCST